MTVVELPAGPRPARADARAGSPRARRAGGAATAAHGVGLAEISAVDALGAITTTCETTRSAAALR